MKVYVVVDGKPRQKSEIKADALVKDLLLAKSVSRVEGEKIRLHGVEVKDTEPLKQGDIVYYTSAPGIVPTVVNDPPKKVVKKGKADKWTSKF